MSPKIIKRHIPERADLNRKFKETVFTPILIIVIFLLVIAASLLPESVIGINENPYLAVVVIELLTYAVPSLFYCRIRGREFTPGLRLKLFSPSKLLYLSHATIFMMSGIMLISMILCSVVPDAFMASSVQTYAAFAMNERFFDVLYLIVTFAILPAVTEEFLFRGIIIGEYENRGAGVAVFMGAAMFAMSHFSITRLPVYLFSGIVLGCVLYATDSLMASITVHAINNAVVLLGEKYIIHIVEKQNISMLIMFLILGVVVLVSGMLMCFEAGTIYRRYAEENKPSDYAAGGKRGRFLRVAEAFFTPTFLLLVVIFIVRSVIEF